MLRNVEAGDIQETAAAVTVMGKLATSGDRCQRESVTSLRGKNYDASRPAASNYPGMN